MSEPAPVLVCPCGGSVDACRLSRAAGCPYAPAPRTDARPSDDDPAPKVDRRG